MTKKYRLYAAFSVFLLLQLSNFRDISNLKDSWYELSVGGNVKFNNNTYIYADLEKTFGGDIQTKWRYNFGVRYSF